MLNSKLFANFLNNKYHSYYDKSNILLDIKNPLILKIKNITKNHINNLISTLDELNNIENNNIVKYQNHYFKLQKFNNEEFWSAIDMPIDHLAHLFGKIYYEFNLISRKKNEMVIQFNDPYLNTFYGSIHQIQKKINSFLNEEWLKVKNKTKNKMIIKYQNHRLIFHLRLLDNNQIAWATDRNNLYTLANMFKCLCFDFKEKPQDNQDLVIRQRDYLIRSAFGKDTYKIINHLKKQLNASWLANSNKNINRLEYKGLIFYRTKQVQKQGLTGWATNINNHEKLKKLKPVFLKEIQQEELRKTA